MDIKKARAIIEATIFASGEPVSLKSLEKILEIDKKTLLKLINEIIEKFDGEDSGIFISRQEDNFQMCVKEEYFNYVGEILKIKRQVPLTEKSLEVLAIIAYNQPITKSFVEKVREVDCSSIISGLVQRGLIEEAGRLKVPGRPILYKTTLNFLRCFGIASLRELPTINDEIKLVL